MADKDAFIKASQVEPAGWFTTNVGSDRASQVAGAQDEWFRNDRFYNQLQDKAGINESQWVGAMQKLKDAYGAGEGTDYAQHPLFRHLQPGQEGRWQKARALYDSVSSLANKSDTIKRNMQWYNRLRKNLGEGGQQVLQQMGNPAQVFRQTDDGGYKLNVNQLAEGASRYRNALGAPQKASQLLNRAGKVIDYYGKPGQKMMKRVLSGAKGGDPTKSIERARQLLPQIEQLTGRLKSLDVQGEDVARALQQQDGGRLNADQLQAINDRLEQVTGVANYFGDDVRSQVKDRIMSALQEGDLSGAGGSQLQEASRLQEAMQNNDISADQAQSLMGYFSGDEGNLDTDKIGQWTEVMNAAGRSGVDVSRMFTVEEDGNPAFTDVMELLPGAGEGDPLEIFNERYRTAEGTIDQEKLNKDMQGFSKVYDDLELVADNQKMMQQYADKVGLDNPQKLTKRYMDKDGDIDFEAMDREVGFWGKTFQMLKENPEMKEKFDRVTNFGKELEGIGLLAGAKDKLVEWAPTLFADSEGNLRKNTMSAALTVADWGQWLYDELFNEKNPIAWAGTAAVAIPVLKGLWDMVSGVMGWGSDMLGGLLGGGDRRAQQGRYWSSGASRPGYGAVGRARQPRGTMLPAHMRRSWGRHPRHVSTRQLVQGRR